MSFKSIISCFTSCLLYVSGAMAQVNHSSLLFYHISEKDGLADNLVSCFYQDKQGVMWMGTQYGLNSFDGSVISTWQYGTGQGNNRLISDHVNAITSDSDHTLWIATDNGLSAMDLHTKQIQSWQVKTNNYMRGLVLDGHTLWIASAGGLLAFDTQQKTFKSYYNKAANTSAYHTGFNNDCNALLLDKQKHLWLATVNGVWMFDTINQTFKQYDGAGNDPFFDGLINAIFQDHAGNIWAGTWSKGLKQIDPKTNTVKAYYNVAGSPSHVMSMAEQQTKGGGYNLWLSEYLTSFDPQTAQFTPHDLKPVAEAASLDPRCVFVSRDNLLWISTVKGVYILDPSRQLFTHTFVTSQATITNQSSALYDIGDRLYVGGDKDFIFKRFDGQMRVTKDYSPAVKALKGEFAAPSIGVMGATPYGNDLWLSTTAGVLKLDTKTDKITLICKQFKGKNSINFVNNIFIYGDEIWCFPWRNGVWRYDRTKKDFIPVVTGLSEGTKPKALNLQEAVRDGFGNIWITDMDFGLVKYTALTHKFERVVTKDITPYSRAVRVKYLKGKVWLLSNNNVVAVDPKTNSTRSWALPNGMNKYAYEFTNDDHDNLWIATKTGLVVFNTQNHSFNQYTEDDGLINNDMNGVLHLMASGKMLYTGENYITAFNPQDLLRTPAKKDLLLTSVSADDEELSIDGKTIEVPAAKSKVTFKWTLINYTNPLQNRFYAKLDQIDNSWNNTGNKGQVEYNNLPPGKYKFIYKATTADGLATAEKTLVFTVRPSFWQTWWFRLLLVILLIGSVYLIIRNVRMKERRKAALKVQLSELEMKALRAQMNPHFIFNALNSIQECIITQKTEAAYTYLSSFSKLVRLILENSEKQFISLADEIDTLRLYLSVEKLRFDESFEFRINIDANIDTSFIRIPSMIIQPFVENALWHGLIHKKGSKLLSISFKQEGNNLVCTVEDNGIGRAQAVLFKPAGSIQKQSLGMKITTERLNLLEAETVITIDDLQTSDGEAAGTKITFVIPLKY